MLKIIESTNEFEVSTKDGIQVVDFFADWCGPCRMIAPIMQELAESHPNIDVLKVNVDNHNELAMRFNVSSIPLVVILKNGVIVESILGYRPKDTFDKILEKLL